MKIAREIGIVGTVLALALSAQGQEHLHGTARKAATMLVNPLLPSGPDPWVTARDGFYYYMNTTGANLTIWKTRNIADLKDAQSKVVWTPPSSGPYSHGIWAPELHYLRGRWYIYFAADGGSNASHRIYVIENASPDPLQGEWTFKGKVADSTDKWAIDASVFENGDRLYMVWSGWAGDADGVQSIYIAELENPWTVKGPRVRISTPDHAWEKVGDLVNDYKGERNPAEAGHPLHVDVNEGPEILKHAGKIFLTYSASGCWTNLYELGLLEASDTSDLLNTASWKKSDRPVLWESPEAHAYGTGHNGFFKSPDGAQDWIIYHANPEPNQGCGGNRSPRAQPFTWNSDGTPKFGRPVVIGTPIPAPAGTSVR